MIRISKIALTVILASGMVACSEVRKPQSAEIQTAEVFFNEEGQLKIAHFTDTHCCMVDHPEEYAKCRSQLEYVLDTEKPDIAVFTGDVITSVAGAEDAWSDFLKPLDERNIPFVITLGNHDREMLSAEKIATAVTAHPMSLNTAKSGVLDDIAVRVRTKDGKTGAILYCLDSKDYEYPEGKLVYGWFSTDQIRNYVDASRQFTEENGGNPVPSYAFFHIPLPEFRTAWEKNGFRSGVRQENECPGVVNAGMFAAFLEQKDVKAIFCGHDHDNDYVTELYGITMAYGRYSGYNTVYNHLERGVRIIELGENGSWHSWIRPREGETIDYI